LLGVGPMSLNCVDASIEIANEYDIPLFLIASRRQIDSTDMGGGYVNNWTTEEFSKYVLRNDKKGKIILARDHGGPWQNTKEVENNLSLKEAMNSAKRSYQCDIESGFEKIHIDPSIDIHKKLDPEETLYRIYELYDFCWEVAKKNNKDIIFEIGTEEQSGGCNTLEEIDYVINKVQDFTKKNKMTPPTFIVVQTGTRVMETKNVGTLDSPIRVSDDIPGEIYIPKVLELCERNNILLKQHNTDYLSDELLSWHPKLGIHSANVAPEYGVAETRALINMLKENQLEAELNNFLDLSYSSKKWSKWMIPNTQATDYDRSIISGHYVFANPEFLEIKGRVSKKLAGKGIDLDEYLKQAVKQSIFRYIKNFRLVK
jgi:hypothetical protein